MRQLLPLILLVLTGTLSAHPGVDQQLRRLTAQITAMPSEQSLYIQRGSVYSMDGRFDRALVDFRRAELLGSPHQVAFELGVLFYRKGNFDRARAYFDTTLEHWPAHAPALEYRARVLRDAGDYQDALADLSRFFELTQQPNPGHYVAAANMLSESPREGIDAALAVLDLGMDKLGLTPTLQQFAVELELKRNQPQAAIGRHESLQPMLGESPEWKVRMGELILATGDNERAQEWFNAALEQLQTLKQTPARQRLGAHTRLLVSGL